MNEPAAGIGEEKRPDEESDSAVVDMKEREPEDILEENPNKTAESAALLDIPPEDESAGPDGEKPGEKQHCRGEAQEPRQRTARCGALTICL